MQLSMHLFILLCSDDGDSVHQRRCSVPAPVQSRLAVHCQGRGLHFLGESHIVIVSFRKAHHSDCLLVCVCVCVCVSMAGCG
jgi:hypothetical protein